MRCNYAIPLKSWFAYIHTIGGTPHGETWAVGGWASGLSDGNNSRDLEREQESSRHGAITISITDNARTWKCGVQPLRATATMRGEHTRRVLLLIVLLVLILLLRLRLQPNPAHEVERPDPALLGLARVRFGVGVGGGVGVGVGVGCRVGVEVEAGVRISVRWARRVRGRVRSCPALPCARGGRRAG
jgi:hypothetical protein